MSRHIRQFIDISSFQRYYDIFPGQKVEILIDGISRGFFKTGSMCSRLYVIPTCPCEFESTSDSNEDFDAVFKDLLK